jgi:hypothetical protein
MAKRIFAALVISLLVGLPVNDTQAQLMPVAVDGCAKLARVIYSEVFSAAAYGPSKSGPWLIDQGQSDISVCSHTAKTVSRAFTSAMQSAGYGVNWRRDWDDRNRDRGDYCLSGFLSQCYPDRYPMTSIASSHDASLVRKSWAVVSEAVMREMYNPVSSDEVRFRDNDLKLRLGLSLRSLNTFDDR